MKPLSFSIASPRKNQPTIVKTSRTESLYKNLAETQTLNRGNYALVWVVSQGYCNPPYTLTVSGTGFHFVDQAGPTTVQLNNEFETVELWADSTA